MLRVDIGCGESKPSGFVGVDVCPGTAVDIVADLSKTFPFQDSSVDELRAYDVVEHLPDRINTMNEIWRVCKAGAVVDILVPSTDARGAFQDPTHVSFWNINSFRYYCVEFPSYYELCRKYGFEGAFRVLRLENHQSTEDVIHVKAVLEVIKPIRKPVRNSEALADASDQVSNFQNPFLAKFSCCISNYVRDPLDEFNKNHLWQIRKQIASDILNSPISKLESQYAGQLAKLHRLLLVSGILYEPLPESEKEFLEEILSQIIENSNESVILRAMLAAMLYVRADDLPWEFNLDQIPSQFLEDSMQFMLASPMLFQSVGDAKKYCDFMQNWVKYLHCQILNRVDSPFWQAITDYFAQTANFIPLYFNELNLKEIYIQRSEILEQYLQLKGYDMLDFEFPEPELYRKPRLGILAASFLPSAETFASLPVYEYISRDFEVILYSLHETGHPLEQYCRSCANAFKVLPSDLAAQVNSIRADSLDILFIGTNVTAVTNDICLLALHRLARNQVTSGSSVTTTGIRHIDYYISGRLTEAEDAEQHYREKLVKLEGTAQCFSYKFYSSQTAELQIDRRLFGIPEKAVVFASAANLHKLLPELLETWAQIIASVPKSVLLLFPYGPNWSRTYPKALFSRQVSQIFAKFDLQPDRFIICDLEPVPDRNELKEYLKLADIYLDSYPFAGTSSLVDPLEVGLPSIAWQGNCFRSAMGAALLKGLGMPELIASDRRTYIQLAVDLANNQERRSQTSKEIRQQVRSNPCFLDSRGYSAQVSILFKELIQQQRTEELRKELRLRTINWIAFPNWYQTEEEVFQDLVDLLRSVITHPNCDQLSLLLYLSNFDETDADVGISSMLMHLFSQEEIEVSGEGPEIVLVKPMSQNQWQMFFDNLSARILLNVDDQKAIDSVGAGYLLTHTISDISNSIFHEDEV